MTDYEPSGVAMAVLVCRCGRTFATPLLLGSGNDFAIDEPDGWYIAYAESDAPIVECPDHRSDR